MGEPAEVLPFATPEDRERYERNQARRGRSGPMSGKSWVLADMAAARTLPHSLEAEEYLLSCCLLDGADTVTKCLQAKPPVRPESFYEPKHGVVFASILRLFAGSKPIDVAVVAEELKSAGQLDAIGGYAFLSQVSGRVPTTAQVGFWIERVREQALLREIIRAASGVVEESYVFKGEIDEFAGSVSRKIMALTGDRTGLPAVQRDDELEAEVLVEPPMLIDKVAHVGGVCLLLAPSKASKTFTCMDISVAVASGSPWVGFKTHQAGVLHIDFELPKWDLKKRAANLKFLRGIKGPVPVEWWSLRGRSKPIEELAPLIIARAGRGKFGLIVLEPAYKILGKRDENDNADVTDFMNWLFTIQEATGATVLCTHHFAKGDAGKKDTKDRGSGAGTWMRAPDTAVVLTPLAEEQGEDCYSMEFIERSMKRHAPVGVQFDYPVFRTKEGLDLNALREAGRPKETTEKNIVELLQKRGAVDVGSGLSFSAVMEMWEKTGSSRSSGKRRLQEAVDVGRVKHVGQLYFVAGAES